MNLAQLSNNNIPAIVWNPNLFFLGDSEDGCGSGTDVGNIGSSCILDGDACWGTSAPPQLIQNLLALLFWVPQ